MEVFVGTLLLDPSAIGGNRIGRDDGLLQPSGATMKNGRTFGMGTVGGTIIVGGGEHGAGAMAHPLEEAGQRVVQCFEVHGEYLGRQVFQDGQSIWIVRLFYSGGQIRMRSIAMDLILACAYQVVLYSTDSLVSLLYLEDIFAMAASRRQCSRR